MASISAYKDGWRAQIFVGGVRESAIFKQRFQAEAWAHDRESVLKDIKQRVAYKHMIKNDAAKFFECDPVMSEEDVVNSSIPIPIVCGIYFLIDKKSVVYVGQSKNVYKRINQHLGFKSFDRISVIECKQSDLDALEAIYIKKFKPAFNVIGLESKKESDLIEMLYTNH